MQKIEIKEEFIVAIPARYASVRLPGKPLRPLAGRPMIAHVADRALEAGASEVVVATDDERIAQAVQQDRVRVCMTSASHASGTDRIAECARQLGWPDERIVLNLQGDEPLAPAAAIRTVVKALIESGAKIATLAEVVESGTQLFDPNCVKLVRDEQERALYFSRAPIPWDRDRFAHDQLVLRDAGWLRHIGMYAYRSADLLRFAALPESRLEGIERLEQLRALEAGWSIAAPVSPVPVPGGVDTEADLERVAAILESRAADVRND